MMWVSPTDEELVKKYNPDLQKRSREGRYERQKEFDDYVTKLKEYSKSDKPSMLSPTRGRHCEMLTIHVSMGCPRGSQTSRGCQVDGGKGKGCGTEEARDGGNQEGIGVADGEVRSRYSRGVTLPRWCVGGLRIITLCITRHFTARVIIRWEQFDIDV